MQHHAILQNQSNDEFRMYKLKNLNVQKYNWYWNTNQIASLEWPRMTSAWEAIKCGYHVASDDHRWPWALPISAAGTGNVPDGAWPQMTVCHWIFLKAWIIMIIVIVQVTFYIISKMFFQVLLQFIGLQIGRYQIHHVLKKCF